MASPCFRAFPFVIQFTDKVEGKCLHIDTFRLANEFLDFWCFGELV